MIKMLNCDCMAYMATLPDKAFDLAIVDPPYGIGDALVAGGTWSVKWQKKGVSWDVAPGHEYFAELFRVSKNQIIWGGNYFTDKLPVSVSWIVWDKMRGEDTNFADGELAWTSFDSNTRFFRYTFDGFRQGPKCQSTGPKIHPTQKPVALYKWLLTKYAKTGDKILDTHGGSGSIAISCHDLGFDLTWMELDADYYAAAVKRYQAHASQGLLFEPMPENPKQGVLDGI